MVAQVVAGAFRGDRVPCDRKMLHAFGRYERRVKAVLGCDRNATVRFGPA
jgi:hypothetical protein